MKRFIICFIVLFLPAGLLSACGDPADGSASQTEARTGDIDNTYIQEDADALELYNLMMSATTDLKSVDFDESSFYNTVRLDNNETLENRKVRWSIRQVFNESHIDVDINAISENNDETFHSRSYHIGGMIYYEMKGMLNNEMQDRRVKSESTTEIQDDLRNRVAARLPELDESMIRSVDVSNHEGGIKIEMSLARTALIVRGRSYEDQIRNSQWVFDIAALDYPIIVAAVENIEIIIDGADIKCAVMIDKNGILQSFSMISEVYLIIEGVEVTRVRETSVTVNSYNNVIIDFPDDLDEW
jgi:hypothetical protein